MSTSVDDVRQNITNDPMSDEASFLCGTKIPISFAHVTLSAASVCQRGRTPIAIATYKMRHSAITEVCGRDVRYEFFRMIPEEPAPTLYCSAFSLHSSLRLGLISNTLSMIGGANGDLSSPLRKYAGRCASTFHVELTRILGLGKSWLAPKACWSRHQGPRHGL